MAEHPDKQPITPDETPDHGSDQPDNTQTPVQHEGWHEPPVEEGASRPVVVGGWYSPPSAEAPGADRVGESGAGATHAEPAADSATPAAPR